LYFDDNEEAETKAETKAENESEMEIECSSAQSRSLGMSNQECGRCGDEVVFQLKVRGFPAVAHAQAHRIRARRDSREKGSCIMPR
jgi:hypothetical protein